MHYKRTGRNACELNVCAYLCPTITVEVSYVLEYILDTIDEADILKMAESVKAREKYNFTVTSMVRISKAMGPIIH